MPSSSREEGVWPSRSKKERVMTMVILFHTSVESCGGDHGISSREEGVGPSSSKRKWSMTMAIFLPSSVEIVKVAMTYLLEKRRSALLLLRRREG